MERPVFHWWEGSSTLQQSNRRSAYLIISMLAAVWIMHRGVQYSSSSYHFTSATTDDHLLLLRPASQSPTVKLILTPHSWSPPFQQVSKPIKLLELCYTSMSHSRDKKLLHHTNNLYSGSYDFLSSVHYNVLISLVACNSLSVNS